MAGCARAVACRSLARLVRGIAAACVTTGCSALAVTGAASAVITGLAAAASGAAWIAGLLAGARAAASAGPGGWATRPAVGTVCTLPGACAGSKAGSWAVMSQPMMPSAPRVQQDARTARRAGAAATGCGRGRTTTGSGFASLDGVQWQARCGASTSMHVVSIRAVYALPDRASDVPRNVHSRPSGMPSSGRNRGMERSPSTGTNGDGFMAAIRGAARGWMWRWRRSKSEIVIAGAPAVDWTNPNLEVDVLITQGNRTKCVTLLPSIATISSAAADRVRAGHARDRLSGRQVGWSRSRRARGRAVAVVPLCVMQRRDGRRADRSDAGRRAHGRLPARV